MKLAGYLIIKIIVITVLLLLSAISLLLFTIFLKGYWMYKRALKKKPMQRTIDEIRQRQSFVPLQDISIEFIYILLIAEDKFFFQHKGYMIKTIYKAFLLNCKQRRIVTGASTISQQLVKNLFFTFDKIYSRKVAEIFAVRKLESMLSKEEILELYCNCIEFGTGLYGIKAACDHYYQIAPSEISLKYAVEIAAVLPAPRVYLLAQRNELFEKSLMNIKKLVVQYICPEEQEYFWEHHDIPSDRREDYSKQFLNDYLQKKKEHGCLIPPYRRK